MLKKLQIGQRNAAQPGTTASPDAARTNSMASLSGRLPIEGPGPSSRRQPSKTSSAPPLRTSRIADMASVLKGDNGNSALRDAVAKRISGRNASGAHSVTPVGPAGSKKQFPDWRTILIKKTNRLEDRNSATFGPYNEKYFSDVFEKCFIELKENPPLAKFSLTGAAATEHIKNEIRQDTRTHVVDTVGQVAAVCVSTLLKKGVEAISQTWAGNPSTEAQGTGGLLTSHASKTDQTEIHVFDPNERAGAREIFTPKNLVSGVASGVAGIAVSGAKTLAGETYDQVEAVLRKQEAPVEVQIEVLVKNFLEKCKESEFILPEPIQNNIPNLNKVLLDSCISHIKNNIRNMGPRVVGAPVWPANAKELLRRVFMEYSFIRIFNMPKKALGDQEREQRKDAMRERLKGVDKETIDLIEKRFISHFGGPNAKSGMALYGKGGVGKTALIESLVECSGMPWVTVQSLESLNSPGFFKAITDKVCQSGRSDIAVIINEAISLGRDAEHTMSMVLDKIDRTSGLRMNRGLPLLGSSLSYTVHPTYITSSNANWLENPKWFLSTQEKQNIYQRFDAIEVRNSPEALGISVLARLRDMSDQELAKKVDELRAAQGRLNFDGAQADAQWEEHYKGVEAAMAQMEKYVPLLCEVAESAGCRNMGVGREVAEELFGRFYAAAQYEKPVFNSEKETRLFFLRVLTARMIDPPAPPAIEIEAEELAQECDDFVNNFRPIRKSNLATDSDGTEASDGAEESDDDMASDGAEQSDGDVESRASSSS